MGSHCEEPSCKQLDYLPMKCDACSRLFCKDHLLYDDHTCSGKYKKDIQVPVCPLCSAPIPIARGAVPDLAVSAHIDQGCPEKNKKEKVFKNRCHAVKHGKQCKKHELVACICSACQTNFCLAHRHPTDHDCKGAQPAAARAAAAAASRAPKQQQSAQSKVTDFFTGPFRPTAAGPRVSSNPSPAAAAALNRQAGRGSTSGRPLMAATNARQVNGMSEDEALAAAMAASLATSEQQVGGAGAGQGLSQEEEDLALARALQESEAMARRSGMGSGQQQGQGVGQGDKNCILQ